jgi:hypothetical protein
MLTFLFVICFQDVYQIPSTQFKIQDENNPETHLSGVKQLESNGQDLFLLTIRQPGVLQFSGEGHFIRRIGRKGQGPGELGNRRSGAMAVNGESVWIRTHLQMFLFHKGDFLHSFRFNSYQHTGSSGASRAFTFSPDHLIVQAHPSSRNIASVFNYDGSTHKMIGELASANPVYLKTNPALNFTVWTRDEDHYYCLFVYRPMIVVYNRDFEKVKELKLRGPEISAFEEKFLRNEPDPHFDYPKPHFTDIKTFRGHLYVMCDGMLYQLDKEDGQTLSRSIFIGNEAIWKERGEKRKLYYYHMAFLDDGTFFLCSSSEFYDAFLWKADLPFIAGKGAGGR